MILALVSFLAGVLTVAAPCILPLLPVIVGGTIAKQDQRRWYRPLVIAVSLAVSVILFTLALKATTALLSVPQFVWNGISGGVVILFGVSLLLPRLWEKFALRSGLYTSSQKLLGTSYVGKGLFGDVLLGAALGPVFSSCSPTYALIVATVLPQEPGRGLIYLGMYALGLAVTLLLVGLAGQRIVRRLGWLSNPNGWFKKLLGIVFIAVGVAVLFGLDKQLQTFILERGWYDPVQHLELRVNEDM